MSASNARISSTPATIASLRPRTARLISGLSEGGEADSAASAVRSASPLPASFDNRPVSPIPSARLPRPGSSHGSARPSATSQAPARSLSVKHGKAGSVSVKSFAGLWDGSWSALHGIASDLLGNDGTADSDMKEPYATRFSGRSSSQRVASSTPPKQWGPSESTSHLTVGGVGAGTREEQIAALRAQKKRDMLSMQESSYADTLSKFKRRLSDDRASISAPPTDNGDRDAMAYVHHVTKDDTLAGITIKYNCSASIIRRANRMWPNDPVQSRTAIILPVDACGVKGRLLGEHEVADLIASEREAPSSDPAEEVPDSGTAQPTGHRRSRTNSGATSVSKRPLSSAASSSVDPEPPWQHDSWVLLPGSIKPVEVARLSRRALGYFPPARRKSNSYSDFDTPSTSLDLSRAPITDPLALSPSRQEPPQRPRRTRRLSTATNGYFPAYLAGPGGVGTMDKNVRSPGPAQDGLNKLFAKHLPDVAPPRNQQALLTPGLPLYTDEPTPSASGTSTPNLRKSINLENVGGAIESWVRRVASGAKHALEPHERHQEARVSVGVPSKGVGGVGDLIEMTNEFEIGDDEGDEEPDRGRQAATPHIGSSSTPAMSFFEGAAGRARSSKARDPGGKGSKDD